MPSVLDIVTLMISVVGLLIGVAYLHLVEKWHEEKDEASDFKRRARDALLTHQIHIDAFLKDYEITNREVERRENIGLIIGSILITSSFIILGNTTLSAGQLPKFPYAATSVSLFAIWLFVLHGTTVKLDKIAYTRLRNLEVILSEYLGYDFGIHSHLRLTTRKKKTQEKAKDDKIESEWWLDCRRSFWGLVLILLSVAWFLVSIFN